MFTRSPMGPFSMLGDSMGLRKCTPMFSQELCLPSRGRCRWLRHLLWSPQRLGFRSMDCLLLTVTLVT